MTTAHPVISTTTTRSNVATEIPPTSKMSLLDSDIGTKAELNMVDITSVPDRENNDYVIVLSTRKQKVNLEISL